MVPIELNSTREGILCTSVVTILRRFSPYLLGELACQPQHDAGLFCRGSYRQSHLLRVKLLKEMSASKSSQDLQKGFEPSTERSLFTHLSSSSFQSLASPFPKDQVRSWAQALNLYFFLILTQTADPAVSVSRCISHYLSVCSPLCDPSFCYLSSCCTGSLCVAVL